MTQQILDSLTTPEVQEYVRLHEHDDERELVLKHKTIHGVPSSIIAEQIRGRLKAKTKLPSFYKTSGIIYPPGVNLEQCSSEFTAKFKADIFKGGLGIVADLTGGFGVDSFFLSKISEHVHYVELNNDLKNIVQHNHQQLGASNIIYHNSSCEEFIDTSDSVFDLMYIDPSRRSETSQKVFKLSDCEPDITKLLEVIFNKSACLLIKTSPLLDLQQGLSELKFVEKVYVVSVNNECKEVLFFCKRNAEGEPAIETINIFNDGSVDTFSFYLSDEKKLESNFSAPAKYLYEPNASILKGGGFKSIAAKYNVAKLHPSTHLYTSQTLLTNFPGRVFEIEALIKPEPKIIKQYFTEGKANVTTRNYPLSVEALKKKTGLKDGGDKYLFGFSGLTEKYLAVATRVNQTKELS